MKMYIIPKQDIYAHYGDLLLKKGKKYELKVYQTHQTHWGEVDSYYVVNEMNRAYLIGPREKDAFWMDFENNKVNYTMLKENNHFRKCFELIK